MIDDLWYKNAVFYCLDVGTFMDANGDGIGDFEGLLRRLDYLAGLGVTALWLQPFQPSPNRDDGYDTADYYGVDRRHGSAGDFVEFTQQARQRGMRVIIDLVINHTSDRHPWFQAARQDEHSQFRDYYYWSKTKPAGANKGMVFPGVQHATWTYDKEARAYYHHRFMPFQPDLNVESPAVREEIRKIMGYWLELGVSGFRVDAVPFIIETMPGYGKVARSAQRSQVASRRGGKRGGKAGKAGKAGYNVSRSREKPRMNFDYLRELHDFLQWRSGDAILLAEANIVPEQNADYFGPEGDRMHMILNFQVNQTMFYAMAAGDCRPLGKALLATRKKAPLAQWGIFLRSHDELDLGRLEDDQRQAVFAAFGPDKSMQLYDRGIRRRMASMVGGDQRRLELAASLIFALPGTPVMRYGDEIGMGDDLTLPDRQPVRTPMQWTGDASGGYSRAAKTEMPVICEGPFGCARINVADQKRDLHSLLNVYERFIRTRKECPEFGWGDFQVLPTRSPHVLAVRCEWRNNAVLSVHNFSAEARQVTLDVPRAEKLPLTNLLAHDDRPANDTGRHVIDLDPYGYKWYRVGPLLDVTTREPA
jgi:maltose alpha-D-glucosyltransferase / alpha-amylase